MRSRLRQLATGGKLFVLALVLGGITFALALMYMRGDGGEASATAAAGSTPRPAATTPVVVARENMPAGIEITSAMVTVRQVSGGTALPGGYSEVSEVVGRVTRYPIVAEEQVVGSRLVGVDGDSTGLAFAIPPGYRAISIPISQLSTAGGLIVPGDRVDVLLMTEYENMFAPGEVRDEETETGEVVVTLLQDVLVLAIAQRVAPPIEPDRDPATQRVEGEDALPNPGAATATVAVRPEQAQLLFLSQHRGSMALAVRAFGDRTVEQMPLRLKVEPVFELGTGGVSN